MARNCRKARPREKINAKRDWVFWRINKVQPPAWHDETVASIEDNMDNIAFQSLEVSQESNSEILFIRYNKTLKCFHHYLVYYSYLLL